MSSPSGIASTPARKVPDGYIFTQPWPAGPTAGRRDQVIYYQYRNDRAGRTLRGIAEQVTNLAIVFAALAVTRFIEARTSWSIKRFVRTARRYRTIQIRADHHLLTAEDPLPPDLRNVLALIK